MEIRIKEVKASDIDQFATEQWAIINKRYNLLPPKETFFFGIYSNKKLVGYAKSEIRGSVIETRDLLIEDGFTGKGFGKNLLNHVENWAKNKKCRKSVVKVPAVYDKTISFYQKNGYKNDATLSDYYYGCDWYYMSKEL